MGPRLSAPPVSGIAPLVQQQGHVVVAIGVGNGEVDGHFRVEAVQLALLVPVAGGKAQPVMAGINRAGQPGGYPAILVGSAFGHECGAAFSDPFQHNPNPGGRFAAADIEDVGGDRAHNSFSSRNSVIFACSCAAFCSSSARVLQRRCSSSSSISGALLPVAQTMKMNPNLSR